MIRPWIAVVASVALVGVAAGSFVAGIATPPANAQEAESLQAKYEKKVSEAWFKDNGFTDDYEQAKATAQKTGKPIFAYFTRSYAP